MLYVNRNFMGNQSWNKIKTFSLVYVKLKIFVNNQAGKRGGGGGGGGGEGDVLCSFLKIGKSALIFEKRIKWVESSIQNLVLRVSRRKSSKIFPCGSLSLVFLKKSKCPNFTKSLLLWKITGWAPEYLNISQFLVHICRSSCSPMFFKLGALKRFTVFWIKKRLQHRCFLFVL